MQFGNQQGGIGNSAAVSAPSVEDIRSWLLDPNSVLRKALAEESLRTTVLPRVGNIGIKLGVSYLDRISHRLSSITENELNVIENDSFLSGAGIVHNVAKLSVASTTSITNFLKDRLVQSSANQ